MRRAGLAIIAAAALVGCDRLIPASGESRSGWVDVPAAAYAAATASPTPTPTQSYSPGLSSVSGQVVTVSAGRMAISSAGRRVEVDLRSVIEVWRETAVPASALEAGDSVFVNGDGGSPFVARYVWANIGRIDGVITAIDATGVLVEVQIRTGGTVLQRIDFSPHIEYGADGVPFAPADLVVGRRIGLVVYGRPGATLRATRIW